MFDALCRDHELDAQHDVETQDPSSPFYPELNGLDCIVHPLLFCAPLAKDTRCVLVVRKPWGQRIVLSRRTASSPHKTVNLARIRSGRCESARQ